MVSRDRRESPIVLQKVRKQEIKFCHDSPNVRKQGIRFWHEWTLQEIIYKGLIPTLGLLHFIHYKTAGALTFLFTPCMECCGHVNCLWISIDWQESNVRKDKRITMVQ